MVTSETCIGTLLNCHISAFYIVFLQCSFEWIEGVSLLIWEVDQYLCDTQGI